MVIIKTVKVTKRDGYRYYPFEMTVLAALLLLLICTCNVEADILDPCKEGFYTDLNLDKIGSRNERCPTASAHETVCDHYLKDDWYAVRDALILNHCPQTGYCGVLYPIWMNGTHPSLSDGIVNRTACFKKFGKCCYETIDIEIKNCSSFLVYHLHPPSSCPTAYCFDSSLPCVVTTTPMTTTGVIVLPDSRCNPLCLSSIIIVVLIIIIIIIVIVVVVNSKGYLEMQAHGSQWNVWRS